jgi:hypothetical protein
LDDASDFTVLASDFDKNCFSRGLNPASAGFVTGKSIFWNSKEKKKAVGVKILSLAYGFSALDLSLSAAALKVFQRA